MSTGSFEEKILHEHNKYRAMHGVPPLKLSAKLTEVAKSRANTLAKTRKMAHLSNFPYGENLYSAWGSGKLDPIVAVKSWYNEIQHYNFRNPGFGMNTGHFTQVVWAKTEQLGCAYSELQGQLYVVAVYDPPGNLMNDFANNVKPPVKN